nr:reverse transcriptase domain-containing protein [Tanacetum cinerariifolium]
TKSVRKWNFPTFTKTSLAMRAGRVINRSASSRIIRVGDTASTSDSGSLPSNTIANPKGDLKAVTTRSSVSYDGPPIPPPFSSLPKMVERVPGVTKDTVQPNVACEEYVQEVLGFFDNSKSGDPTPFSDLIISLCSLSLTLFTGGDFILEEIDACLISKSIPPGIKDTEFDLKGDIQLKLKELSSHLEYVFLEGIDKLPVIIFKELKDEEKSALLKVLKSYKRAIAWKISNIKVYTDHSARKYLLAKQDAKPRLLNWIFLLQEFDIIIRDKKRAENLAADHLSRLDNPYRDELEKKEITETFPLETLGMIVFLGDFSTLWFIDIANNHAGKFIVKGISSQQKKIFFKDVKHYIWDDPYLFKICAD